MSHQPNSLGHTLVCDSNLFSYDFPCNASDWISNSSSWVKICMQDPFPGTHVRSTRHLWGWWSDPGSHHRYLPAYVFGHLAADSHQSLHSKSISEYNIYLPMFMDYSSCTNPFPVLMVCLEKSLWRHLVTSMRPFSRRSLCTVPPGTIYQFFCPTNTMKLGRSLWFSVSHVCNFLISCSQPPKSATMTTMTPLLKFFDKHICKSILSNIFIPFLTLGQPERR